MTYDLFMAPPAIDPRSGDDGTGRVAKPERSVLAAGLCLRLGAGALAAEGAAGWLHPVLGEILVAADVLLPAAWASVLLAAILFGSDRASEKAFRLLRCITGRPEPPAPAPAPPPKPAVATHRAA